MSMIVSQPWAARPEPGKLRSFLARLRHDTHAASAVELAMSLPFLMGLALSGAEIVSLAITHVKLNQLAITVADNASRAQADASQRCAAVPRV